MSDKPQLKIIPKPDGFDLREKRMNKKEDGSEWSPEDVLYHVSQQLQGKRISALVVIWREEIDEDSHYTRWRQSAPRGALVEMVVNVLGRIMGWR